MAEVEHGLLPSLAPLEVEEDTKGNKDSRTVGFGCKVLRPDRNAKGLEWGTAKRPSLTGKKEEEPFQICEHERPR